MKRILIAFLFLSFSAVHSFSNTDSTANNLTVLAGGSGSWWKYNRGLQQGWDRSDFVAYYEVEVAYHRKFQNYQVGLVGSFGAMDEQNIEHFDDRPFPRSKTTVSKTLITFYSLGFEGLKTVVSSSNYQLLIGVGAGSFLMNTTYPYTSTFGTKLYWSGFVKHQINLKNDYFLTIKMAYEKKHIFVPDGLEGEHHEIFKTGMQVGIDKYF